MMNRKRVQSILTVAVLITLGITACRQGRNNNADNRSDQSGRMALAAQMEESLFKDILDRWYPLDIDTIYGGYISELKRDWTPGDGSGEKALVQQARHVWATSRVYEAYPEREEYLDYAVHGFHFLRDRMWDETYGGFHAYCTKEGDPVERSIDDKRIYGEAFAVYGLSRFYEVSRNQEALELAKRAFFWMDEHAHDAQYGGYFEMLHRDGSPVMPNEAGMAGIFGPGLKDYNSSIHIMEALTELYLVWPDDLVRERLEEMFLLIRDTFVHPDGYLRLYFQPDWTLVTSLPDDTGSQREGWLLTHFTYGHDVETAYLLLETAHVLGKGEDEKTHNIAKKLVDHSLASGWDTVNGGFFDAGVAGDDGIRIVNNHKSWWGQVEGMNALLLMHTLYPGDPNDYYNKFLKSWEHIDTYLIDKTYGGWYNNATDTDPETVDQLKSHIWKTTYHNTRGMLNCIRMLRSGESLTRDP
jgi:mannobiose 2-epimerase